MADKYVLDASAIAILLQQLRENALELLKDRITLSLAYYELGNILWKEAVLMKVITYDTALVAAGHLAVILKEMNVIHPTKPGDMHEIMRLTLKTKLTFYDAAYLYTAKKLNAVLVTEDKELRERACEQNVKAISVTQYLKEHTFSTEAH